MRKLLLLLITLQAIGDQKIDHSIASRYLADVSITGCAPSPRTEFIQADESGRFAPVFPGWGHYSYKVRANNDSAQFFFDQGLNLYYSYHLTEALASFKEAARHDAACIMAYWGQALAMGPYYNSYYYKMPAAVLPVLEQMNRISANATGREKDLVGVMNSRYSPDTSDGRRKELNRSYAEGMAGLIKKYPADADIKALYVDAVMLEHTWDFWENYGAPKSWTPELVSYCDDILQMSPSHPAGLHYQIHLVEASQHPEKALASADMLQIVLPGVPHMVHMSSHMYQRNGLYAKGVDVNDKASLLQIQYDSMGRHLKIGTFPLTHFDAVESFCALNANMYGKALQSANHLRKILSTTYKARLSTPFFQYLYMMPMFVYVRSGKWEMIMDEPGPDSSLHYACLLNEFGKGLACVRLHDDKAAGEHLRRLRVLLKDSSLPVRVLPFNAALDGARIAEAILAGELSFSEKKYKEAIEWLGKGAAVEDGMIYREPKDWPIPVRHYLGADLLKLGRAAESEKVYRQDLVLNPGNGWALVGLHRHEEAMRAFSKAEEMPTASAY
jgi:tetratricopeptide (TPR) repeat protein